MAGIEGGFLRSTHHAIGEGSLLPSGGSPFLFFSTTVAIVHGACWDESNAPRAGTHPGPERPRSILSHDLMIKNQLEASMSNSKTTIFVPLLALLMGVGIVSNGQAQSVSLGADAVNRYVWRGTDFGQSMSIQPDLSFSAGGFTIGSWASYAVSPQSAAANEHDLYASYSIETSGGTFSLGVTDYYFPSPAPATPDFFDYDGDAGSHDIEPSVSYTGPEGAPITLYASIFAYGPSEGPVWLEASYPFSVEDVDLSIALGGTPNDDIGFYGTSPDTDAGITKLSLSASKSVPITESFSLPVNVTYYLNPYAATSFLIFGVSL